MRTKLPPLLLLCALLSAPVLFQPSAFTQEERGLRLSAGNGRRVALVIGNSAYADAPLKNPVNDARDIARALRPMGFEVTHKENLSQNEMKRAVREFGQQARGAGIRLFYYAGHGVQVGGENYLIPVGAAVSNEHEVEYEAVNVGQVLAQMEDASDSLNIVILDACRNNPFARSFRSSTRGLAQMKAPTGTLLAYATAPGQVAGDGDESNGLYTQELLRHMRTPGLSAEEVFKRVRISVLQKTQGRQTPWESSSLTGDFYFVAAGSATPAPAAQPSAPSSDSSAVELSFWESIKSSTDAEDFKAYLDAYPAGRFAALARNNLRRLEAARSAAPPTGKNPSASLPAGNAPAGNAPTGNAPTSNATNDPKTTSHPKAGSTVRPRSGIELVYVPPGEFMMGSENGEAYEKPVHRVTIREGFYMGKYEVTQAQWAAVMGNNPSRFKGDNLPVERVSWNDAISFIAKLNAQSDGYTYRLPSEAEWEYACRAGTTGDYAGKLDSMAWYYTNSSGKTHPVGGKQPNAFGLYDMHGNVWEWCEDWYHGTYAGAPNNGSAWLSSGGQNSRVLRGGSWNDGFYGLRSATRNSDVPGIRHFPYGFRVVAFART